MTALAIVLATPHQRHDWLEAALREKLPGYSIVRIRTPGELTFTEVEKIKPVFMFFPHWSWLIPLDIYSTFDCVIFHMTNLPYGRGGSPLQNLIVRGHKDTMLSALKCVKELDAGPLYLQRPLSLTGTAEAILQRASQLAEIMMIEIVKNKLVPSPQKGEVVKFNRRQPEDGNLESLAELDQVYDYIRMLDADGYPRAFLKIAHFHVEFFDAELSDKFITAKVRIRRSSDD